ncbi:eCIS core domain-containing protein [Plantactinospora sp. DSM 117369]
MNRLVRSRLTVTESAGGQPRRDRRPDPSRPGTHGHDLPLSADGLLPDSGTAADFLAWLSDPVRAGAVRRVPGAAGPSAADAGAVGAPGRPLEPTVRAEMESRFGAGLADVRVHTSPSAAASADAVGAAAYTIGRDIVFGPGAYRPHEPAGRALLAHELTHVLQQTAGRNAPKAAAGTMAAECEADQSARSVEVGGAATVATRTPVRMARADGPQGRTRCVSAARSRLKKVHRSSAGSTRSACPTGPVTRRTTNRRARFLEVRRGMP